MIHIRNILVIATCGLVALAVINLVAMVRAYGKAEDLQRLAIQNWVLNCVQIRAMKIQEPLCDLKSIEAERAKVK